jgi:hypothetical protein
MAFNSAEIASYALGHGPDPLNCSANPSPRATAGGENRKFKFKKKIKIFAGRTEFFFAVLN